MRSRRVRALSAGLVDSGLSSLSSFAVGILAARELGAATLGTYALFFTTFLLASAVPVSLVYTPIEIAVLRLAEPVRNRGLRRSFLLGPTFGAVAGVLGAGFVLVVASGADASTRLALAVTTAILVTVSPLQDHTRRIMHSSQRSWSAAAMSGVLLLGTVAAAGAGLIEHVPSPWIPFASLAAGNLLSLVVGLTVIGIWPRRRDHELDLRTSALVRSGRWLLADTGWSYFSGGFLIVIIVTKIAGSAAVGYAEAARVLAQPVTVLAVGLLSVFTPQIMAAAQRGDTATVMHRLRLSFLLVGAVTALWCLVTIFGPIAWLLRDEIPRAYHATGLLPLFIVQQALAYTAAVYANVLVAVGRARYQAALALIAGLLNIAGVTAFVMTGSYAFAFGGLVSSVFWHLSGLRALRKGAAGSSPETGAEPAE